MTKTQLFSLDQVFMGNGKGLFIHHIGYHLHFHLFLEKPKSKQGNTQREWMGVIKIIIKIYMFVDPKFLAHALPLDGELTFYFEKYFDFIFKKMTWSRHLFLFYF